MGNMQLNISDFRKIILESVAQQSPILELDTISNETDLLESGLDSMKVLSLLCVLEEKIGKSIDLGDLEKYEYKVSISTLYALFQANGDNLD